MSEVRCQIYPEKPFIKIYDKGTGIEIPAEMIKIDECGQIVSVLIKKSTETAEDQSDSTSQDSYEEILADKLNFYQDFLKVPGVGYLKPGTYVSLDNDRYGMTYELSLGWYHNSSNQDMYGWYLRPVEVQVVENKSDYMSHLPQDILCDRTLYTWMINHLNKITP